tara:strand:+ start:836 stop:1009 length:174 start_codon:yes stop_codon:yes gene_type:complete
MQEVNNLKILGDTILKYIKNPKKIHFTKLCLSVKPPLEKRSFRHMMKYLKVVILMGG